MFFFTNSNINKNNKDSLQKAEKIYEELKKQNI